MLNQQQRQITTKQASKNKQTPVVNSYAQQSGQKLKFFKDVQFQWLTNKDKQLLIVAYSREKGETSPEQILIQQPRKIVKHQNEEKQLTNLMSQIKINSSFSQSLFLTKINPCETKQINNQLTQMLSFGNIFNNKQRNQRRKKQFDSFGPRVLSNNKASEEVIAQRKIRIVKMDSLIKGGNIQSVVELGGRSMHYEDLNMSQQTHDYYTVKRRMVNSDQVFPQVLISKQMLVPVDYEQQQMEEQNQQDDDSNNSNNPNFDYPEEEQSSRSSQEIIMVNDSDNENNYQSDDQQELYRKYLKRCRKQDQEIDFEPDYEEYD